MGIKVMKRNHTPINQLILETKDLSMFTIERIITADAKYWLLTDLRTKSTRNFKTKYNAELAIVAVVKWAMK
jgi:hypothetical protein